MSITSLIFPERFCLNTHQFLCAEDFAKYTIVYLNEMHANDVKKTEIVVLFL
jgi:hypothetical protein